MKKINRRIASGAVVLLMGTMLVGCGSHQATSTSSSNSSSQQTLSPSAKAIKDAKKFIKEGRYQTALDRLDDVHSPSQKVKDLKADLKNYLQAQDAYSNQQYSQAAESTKTTQSNNSRLQSATKALHARAVQQTGGPTQSQANANRKANDQAVIAFANQMGFNDSHYQIITQSHTNGLYRYEVRHDNDDHTVSNLVGIFDYNPQTKTVKKVNN
ncbi:hypothetical protein [uncultured Limosilactobacillus sp.]|uniref:hypothetical protein n=1 Tax=uncultured Limosilactobacillus sp. TaxID=2837629 RepID=UPI0025CD8907|nr:hypothetical protein [uncultured Limosilactobacillus sp.]